MEATVEGTGRESRDAQLWARIEEVYEAATASGAAEGISTTQTIVKDAELGINVVVRVADALNRKPKQPARSDSGTPQNPFLPYDDNLWVQHLSDSHTLLLNKFNLVAHHVLVVTRAFESQDDALNAKDLAATWRTLQAYPEGALAYFNHGPHSGMSMPHKHLQIIPLPLGSADSGTFLPTSPLIESALEGGGVGEVRQVRALPFRAYACRVDCSCGAEGLERAYSALVAAAGIDHAAPAPPSYSWQLTMEWMLLVPRSADAAEGVGCNTVGYAGSLFVKSQAQVDTVQRVGPAQLLAQMAVPW